MCGVGIVKLKYHGTGTDTKSDPTTDAETNGYADANTASSTGITLRSSVG